MSVLTLTVVVPTHRRVERLTACLDGIRSQTRKVEEVIAVAQTSDQESASFIDGLAATWVQLRRVGVERPGLVAALNCGLAAATGTLVGFVDDDAVPRADWAQRIVDAYAQDDAIAAVGGRDVIFDVDGQIVDFGPGSFVNRLFGSPVVGRIQWYGRMLGNHHVGTGTARDTDVLKGVNMSFRREAVLAHGFDERLRGHGTQVHSEMSICLPLRRRGLRVVYDPQIVVEHFPAPRSYGDKRTDSGAAVVSASTHNEALAILDHFGPGRRIAFTIWGIAIGTTSAPGLAILTWDLLKRQAGGWTRFRAAVRGRLAAWDTHRTARPLPGALCGASAAPQAPQTQSSAPATQTCNPC